MIRCCKHCGALLEDEAQVCDFCGTVLEAPKDIEPAPQGVVAPQEVSEEITEAPVKKKLSKKSIFFLVGGIALVIIAAIVAVNLLVPNPHLAVDKYETVLNGEFYKLESLAPQEYWDYMAESSNTSVDQYIENLAKKREENYLKQMSQDTVLGKLLAKELHVLDTEKVRTAEMTGIRNNLEEEYNISADRVQAAYKLILKVTQKATKGSSSFTGMVTAVQIDSEWYLVRSVQRGEDSWSVLFLTNAHEMELASYYG